MKQLVFVFIIPIQLLLTIGCCDSHSILPYELHWSTIYLSTIYDVFLLKILRDFLISKLSKLHSATVSLEYFINKNNGRYAATVVKRDHGRSIWTWKTYLIC